MAFPPTLSHHPVLSQEAKDDAIRTIYEKLDGIDAGRQGLIDALWARIPAEITEWGYAASATQLTVAPVTTQLVRVRSVVVRVATATGATLTLGTLVFPVPSGWTNWLGLNVMVTQSSVRRLTCTKAGALGLVLCGEIAPQYGHL